MIGSTLAGYRLEAELGHGGMSVVYLAEQLGLARKVAVKVLTPTLGADESWRRRFETEARRVAEIDHPAVIPVYDAGEADGRLFIAMRYVDGGDLAALIRREGTLGLERTLAILEQAAAALDAAHARGLVHRDVKPQNVLIESSTERVFVTDFGIAKDVAVPGLTRTGLFMGTVDYAAPEQLEGKQVDASTDVYALTCVLYECLAGKAPFARESEVGVMHAHLSEAPPRPSATRSDLPVALDAVIAKGMAKAAGDRYPDCTSLIDAAAAASSGTRQPALRRRRPLILVVALALAAGGVIAGLALTRGGGKPHVASSGLAAVVPAALWQDCTPSSTRPGALATAGCRPSSGPVETWEVSLFPGEAYDGYRSIFETLGIAANDGSCSAVAWNGEGPWRRSDGASGGRRLCYVAGGKAVLVWTHERSGGAGRGSVLGIARAPADGQSGLYDWWRRSRERIGTLQSG